MLRFHAPEPLQKLKNKISSTFAFLTRNPDHVGTNSVIEKNFDFNEQNCGKFIQSVPLATEPGFSSIILPLMRILQRNLKRTYLIV
jgi:hypothetical protein